MIYRRSERTFGVFDPSLSGEIRHLQTSVYIQRWLSQELQTAVAILPPNPDQLLGRSSVVSSIGSKCEKAEDMC